MSEFNVKIDSEFKALIPPADVIKFKELEQSILADGCREPIVVWFASILDGHKRFEICERHHIPYETQSIYCRNRQEAQVWICKNELSKIGLTDSARRYLIGKRLLLEQIIAAHNAAGTNQNVDKKHHNLRLMQEGEQHYDTSLVRTREKLGMEYHLNQLTVARYGDYARSIDRIREYFPEIADGILSERIKISHLIVNDLLEQKLQDLQRYCQQLSEIPGDEIPFAITRALAPVSRRKRRVFLPADTGSIKDMPKYDPDAELKSLMLTIPSWVSSIRRVAGSQKLSEASADAKHNLTAELQTLLRTTAKMLDTLKEGNADERL